MVKGLVKSSGRQEQRHTLLRSQVRHIIFSLPFTPSSPPLPPPQDNSNLGGGGGGGGCGAQAIQHRNSNPHTRLRVRPPLPRNLPTNRLRRHAHHRPNSLHPRKARSRSLRPSPARHVQRVRLRRAGLEIYPAAARGQGVAGRDRAGVL